MWGKGSVQIQFFVHKEVHQEIPGDRHDEIDERQKTQQTVGTFRKLYHADAGKGKIDEVQNVIEADGGETLVLFGNEVANGHGKHNENQLIGKSDDCVHKEKPEGLKHIRLGEPRPEKNCLHLL